MLDALRRLRRGRPPAPAQAPAADAPASRAPWGSGEDLAVSVRLSAHCVTRFAERGPTVRGDPTAALRTLIRQRGRAAATPPRWFGRGRPGAEFYVVIDDRYVLPVQMAQPGQLARRAMQPYVASTFVARHEPGAGRGG